MMKLEYQYGVTPETAHYMFKGGTKSWAVVMETISLPLPIEMSLCYYGCQGWHHAPKGPRIIAKGMRIPQSETLM